jgi:protein O-mannosyl-transferase
MNLNRVYVFVIAVVALALYARVVTHEHVLDDQVMIPNQPVLQAPFDVKQVMLARYWEGLRTQDTLYRPVTIWTLAMNHWANTLVGLPGDHPVVYRVASVLLHAGVSVLVFVFARWLGLTPNVGLWAGLLFAVLPIHTEAVAAAVNRSEILALGFGLCFLMLFQTRWLWAGLCLFLALLSKESALLFLPVAGWYALTVRRSFDRFLFWPMIGYFCVVVLWWMLRSVVIGDTLQAVVMLDNPMVMASVGERILTALAVQWQYVFLQVIPFGLSSDYSFNQIPLVQSIWTLDVWFLVAIVVLAGWWAWRVRHTHAVVPFIFGTYVLLLGLTSNVLFPVGTVMGERLVYAPSMCLCVLGGWGIASVSRNWVWWIGGVLVVIYGAVTVTRLGVWENAQTFYTAQVVSAPQSAKAHYAVAHEVYQPASEWDRAVEHYERAIKILPNYPDAWNNLGVIKKDQGDLQGALTAYETALKWHLGHVAARVNMGQVFQTLGEDQKAIDAYVVALEGDSTHAIAGNNLAILYAQHGQADSARVFFERVLRHHPNYVPAQNNYQLFLNAIDKP